jgi:K+-transporting ATPase ATPase C chain
MKSWSISIRLMILMTLLLGVIYPFTVTGLAKFIFSDQANGNLVSKGGQVVGSRLIGQEFHKSEYFWSRPSAINYNPIPSGGSNQGPTSKALYELTRSRRQKLIEAHPDQTNEPPQDLIFASGSGLDPHISPAAAYYQLERVAKARNIQPDELKNLIEKSTETKVLGFFGEPRVNVFLLNLNLDQLQGATH